MSKVKLCLPIEIEWSLNFRASTPTLYVKNKMAEASFLPEKEGKKFFLGHSRVFLLDFLFQDLGILSRISLKLDPEDVPEGNLLINYLFI